MPPGVRMSRRLRRIPQSGPVGDRILIGVQTALTGLTKSTPQSRQQMLSESCVTLKFGAFSVVRAQQGPPSSRSGKGHCAESRPLHVVAASAVRRAAVGYRKNRASEFMVFPRDGSNQRQG